MNKDRNSQHITKASHIQTVQFSSYTGFTEAHLYNQK